MREAIQKAMFRKQYAKYMCTDESQFQHYQCFTWICCQLAKRRLNVANLTIPDPLTEVIGN